MSSYLQSYMSANVGQRVMHDLRRTVYSHIQRLSLAEHDEKRTGDLISRVTSDIDSIQDFVSTALLGIVANILTLLGIVGIMLYASLRFTVISLAIAPVLFVVVYLFTRRIKKASRAVRKTESALISTVQEVFSSIRVVKAFAREDYEQQRFERQSLDNVESFLEARGMKMLLSPIVDVVVATGTCLMLAYGARMVMANQLSVGDLVVFLAYLRMMYKPMRDLSKMADTVSKASIGFERIREILETESAVRDLRGARTARGFKGRIEFDHVSFGYKPDQLVLNDLSFTIEPGQVVAFVGQTGGGKTSIVNLIARFYDPTSGRSRSTARTSAASRSSRSATRSASCSRTRSCSTYRSGRTSPTAVPRPGARRSCAPPSWRTPTSSSRRWRRGTTRWSANGGSACPGASASVSPSPGP